MLKRICLYHIEKDRRVIQHSCWRHQLQQKPWETKVTLSHGYDRETLPLSHNPIASRSITQWTISDEKDQERGHTETLGANMKDSQR